VGGDISDAKNFRFGDMKFGESVFWFGWFFCLSGRDDDLERIGLHG